MNIGERLNKFDLQTTGTVKEFNEIFPECPLSSEYSPESVVEVGGIVGAGQVTKRLVWVDEKLTEHLFEKVRYYKDDKSNRAKYKPKGNYSIRAKYELINNKTGETFKATKLKELADKANVPYSIIKAISQDKSANMLYTLIKEKKGVVTVHKPSDRKTTKQQFIYYVNDGKEVKEFKYGKEVLKYLKISAKTLLRKLKTGEEINGHTLTRRKL